MEILRCGLDAVLVELDGRDEVLGLRAALRGADRDGVRELIPAARTLLIRYDPRLLDPGSIHTIITELPVTHESVEDPAELTVPVRYDGPDLDEVASLTGLSSLEVAYRHRSSMYTVAFCGFAPGFAYLTGIDRTLRLPRRDTPRIRVPAGSVAIADEYTGIYPRSSPGGWHLIGTTDLAVWDLERDPVTWLSPGTRVRFEEVTR